MDLLRVFLFGLCALCTTSILSAGNYTAGARASGLAGATIALYDFWAVNHNQAGLARADQSAAGIHTETNFMLPDMNMAVAAYLLPTSKGTFAFSVNHFGNKLYREGKAGLAYARNFSEQLSAGISLNYLHTNIAEGYGSTSTLAAEAGIIYTFKPGLQLGVHVFNPTRAVLTTHEYLSMKEHVATVFRAGLAYHFSESTLACLELEKTMEDRPVVKAGVEYAIRNTIKLRTGFQNNPMINTLGIGVKTGKLQIDISAAYHYILGSSPQAGIIYTF